MSRKFSLSTIIVTFFAAGFFPKAPGTFASLLAFPLYFLLNVIEIKAIGRPTGLASAELINNIMLLIVALFFLGVWATEQYCHRTGKQDPKEVVIDEIVGQMLAICLIVYMLPFIGTGALMKVEQHGVSEFSFVILNLVSAFILFRIFDIMKPWPISYIDKNWKGGFGVMFDDVVAAIFAFIMHYFILFAILDRL